LCLVIYLKYKNLFEKDVMKREKVKSTALKSVGYDPDERLLETELITDRIYLYKEVPETVYTNLRKAKSLGKYYNKYIKDEYECEEKTK
jgi:hypothetical protein